MRSPDRKKGQSAAPILSARLAEHVTLEGLDDGQIIARIGSDTIGLGEFSAGAAKRHRDSLSYLPLRVLSADNRDLDHELLLLVRRLAARGLLEYRFGRSRKSRDEVVVEPQVPDYWPRPSPLGNADVLALSRFAYMRRRGNDLILESPRARAVFRICDRRIAAIIATMAVPQKLSRLRRQDGFPGLELLALLVDSSILFKVDNPREASPRQAEGDDSLVLWDFHDLLFHARSTEGRHANPLGGVYPYAGSMAPLPAVRPSWPGEKVKLGEISATDPKPSSPTETLLHARHSTRTFDDGQPITLAELARFLDRTARVRERWENRLEFAHDGPAISYAARPYPSAGSAYEVELYLAVHKCAGLAQGFYHYDAGDHALVRIGVRAHEFDALLGGAVFAMGVSTPPQVLVTIAARFGRISWKYSSIAYALILKDVGVFTQTLYMMAADMALGGCAIGTVNIELFAKMTGIELHVEGPVGQFALGRPGPQAQTELQPTRP